MASEVKFGAEVEFGFGNEYFLDQPSNNEPCRDKSAPSPSKPIMLPNKRCLPPPGELTIEHTLSYPRIVNCEGLGCLGSPVNFKFKNDVSPVQILIHPVLVAKRIKVKDVLDRYAAAGIIKKVEEPTS